MKNMKWWKRLICFIKGHNVGPLLYEDDSSIYTTGCLRCKSPIGLPKVWKAVKSMPAPGTSQIRWEDWCENYWQEVRDSVNVKG